MITRTEQLAIDQGRKFATPQQYLKVLRRRLPETFQVRNAGVELKGISEAELVLGVICQAWSESDDAFFLDEQSYLSNYCNLLDIDVAQVRRDFDNHNKGYFFKMNK